MRGNNIEYLTAEQILLIHSILVDETGGSHGLRDEHALLTLEELPKQEAFGEELYPDIFTKAALYCRNILMSHPFVDGNKRTGMTSAGVFLENNGYVVVAKQGEIEKFAVEAVVKKYDLPRIATWFKKHSKKIK